MNGQKIHLPRIASSAGISVVMTANATTMPAAATGPSPRTSFIWPASRHNSPTVTVAADARTAGIDRRQATAMATCRLAWRRSSSR
jgi:hypothetical protein